MKNDDWLRDYFASGFYEHYWKWQIQQDDEVALAENAMDLLDASTGHILDWCGGWGRVSIAFARKGFRVTILDFISEYLHVAEKRFKAENLALEVVQADCRNTPASIQADYATCFFNTVGFFEDAEQIKAFKSLCGALRPGGKLIIDCMNLLFLAPLIKPVYDTKRDDGYLFRQNNTFDFTTNTLDSVFEIIDAAGKVEQRKEFHQRIYTPMDLKMLLEASGFTVQGMYGDYSGAPVTTETPQVIMVAGR
jgi:ubiquinone/menaquinone biosynthesis C-methylase UbiE